MRPQQAAEAIGCSRPTVLRWEKDADSISGEYLLSAARVYKVAPEWLAMKSDDDRFPWRPDGQPEPAQETSRIQQSDTPNAGSPSQYSRPDPDILHEALTLLAHSEHHGGPLPPKARTRELLRLYDWCARDGGELSDESNAAFVASVWARKLRQQGVTESGEAERHG